MIDNLKIQQQQAYLFETVDPSVRLRYNVRLGQYHSRQRAVNELVAYKAYFKTRAYIVSD